jgi:hypothetical protein
MVENQEGKNPHQIYDRIFKKLMMLSKKAIIVFINALFGTEHPLDAEIEYLSTEHITDKLGLVICDIIIRINGIYEYLIEVQISKDNEMSFMIWNYSYLAALRRKITEGDTTRIKLIPAIVIYLESDASVPDSLKVEMEDLDGKVHEFKFPTLKLSDYTPAELEERKLTILSLFQLLKPRNRVKAATAEGRKELSEEMKELVLELEERIERGVELELMEVEDKGIIFALMKRLYNHLYGGYEEFKEANKMVEDLIITETEEAELREAFLDISASSLLTVN